MVHEKFKIDCKCDLDDDTTLALVKVFRLHAPEGMDDCRVWEVQLGPTQFSPDDFIPRAPVFINGDKVGEICVEKVIDAHAMTRKPSE